MIKTTMTVYICDHCGQIFRGEAACKLHEYWCDSRPYPDTKTYKIEVDWTQIPKRTMRF